MPEQSKQPASAIWKGYLLCYLLFLLLGALLYYDVFVIGVAALRLLAPLMFRGGRCCPENALFSFAFLGMGIGGFVWVMAAEPYLRHGVERGDLRRRFTRLAVPLVVAGLLGTLFWFLASMFLV
jgi:hypothetical protein